MSTDSRTDPQAPPRRAVESTEQLPRVERYEVWRFSGLRKEYVRFWEGARMDLPLGDWDAFDPGGAPHRLLHLVELREGERIVKECQCDWPAMNAVRECAKCHGLVIADTVSTTLAGARGAFGDNETGSVGADNKRDTSADSTPNENQPHRRAADANTVPLLIAEVRAEEVTYLSVVLTPSERDMIAWAADPMYDFWRESEERAEEGCRTYNNPLDVTETGCEIVADREVLSDLRYRLLEQIPDMDPLTGPKSKEHMDWLRGIKAARSAYEKIETAFNREGI